MLPLGSLKNVSPFGLAVWLAIGNINTNVLFYYKDEAKKHFYLRGVRALLNIKGFTCRVRYDSFHLYLDAVIIKALILM